MASAFSPARSRKRWVMSTGLAVAVACTSTEPEHAPVAPSLAAVQEIGRQLRSAGYGGPFAVSTSTSIERGRRGRPVRGLLLAESGTELLAGDSRFAQAILGCCGQASLVESANPDSIDTPNNTAPNNIAFQVMPSTLNIAGGALQVQINLYFVNYKPGTDSVYFVPGGEVLSFGIVARARAAGHYHGDSLSERMLDRRIGILQLASTIFTGQLQTTWLIPEVSGEMKSEFLIREIGGPRDGQTSLYTSIKPNAVRNSTLVQLPANDTLYKREGGTTPHPAGFNIWGREELVSAITQTASDYKAATGKLTRVNDMSLFYGGKFDIGRVVGNLYFECANNVPGNCWGGPGGPRIAHAEHRHGTEVDINPEVAPSAANRKEFVRILNTRFTNVYVESNHYHARTAQSPYIRSTP